MVATTDGYEGSEFCSGLLFGIHGSNMLLNVAKTFTQKIEKIIEEINRIRKEVKLFEDQNTISRYNRTNFNNEVYIKL